MFNLFWKTGSLMNTALESNDDLGSKKKVEIFELIIMKLTC